MKINYKKFVIFLPVFIKLITEATNESKDGIAIRGNDMGRYLTARTLTINQHRCGITITRTIKSQSSRY